MEVIIIISQKCSLLKRPLWGSAPFSGSFQIAKLLFSEKIRVLPSGNLADYEVQSCTVLWLNNKVMDVV